MQCSQCAQKCVILKTNTTQILNHLRCCKLIFAESCLHLASNVSERVMCSFIVISIFLLVKIKYKLNFGCGWLLMKHFK